MNHKLTKYEYNLENINMKRSDIEEKLYWYRAKLNFIYDGDSVTAFELDFGFGLTQITNRGDRRGIRFYGIDTPELNTDEGKKVRDYIKPFEGQTVFVRSIKDSSGKYGRYLFELWVPKLFEADSDEYFNLNKHLIEIGMAKNLSY